VTWSYLHGDVHAVVHAGWVGKKIKELMGQDEPSFCEFIMTQVRGHEPAGKLLESLREILDEDADSFVQKLFQVHSVPWPSVLHQYSVAILGPFLIMPLCCRS
jgi:RNA-binding protein 25